MALQYYLNYMRFLAKQAFLGDVSCERRCGVRFSPTIRTLLLIADGAALIGVVVFSVLAALERNESSYVIGQIVCAVIILVSALLLHRSEGASH